MEQGEIDKKIHLKYFIKKNQVAVLAGAAAAVALTILVCSYFL